MRALAAALLVAGIVSAVALPAGEAAADDGDTASGAVASLLIGQQSPLVIEVAAPPGATIEVDPANPSWNGVEVIRASAPRVTEANGRTIYRIDLVVAPFTPGEGSFAPAVNVVVDGQLTPRVLPMVSWTVRPSLAADAPLELSPLAPPRSIEGAESPFLKPLLALAAVAIVAVLAAAAILSWRYRQSHRPEPASAPLPALRPPDLGMAEKLIDRDPVSAYRTLASTVRLALSRRYGLPATALTTGEIRRRMEEEGVERWHARLVGGLLEECDAVVYAGYRPASERRQHDLTTAREIVGQAE